MSARAFEIKLTCKLMIEQSHQSVNKHFFELLSCTLAFSRSHMRFAIDIKEAGGKGRDTARKSADTTALC